MRRASDLQLFSYTQNTDNTSNQHYSQAAFYLFILIRNYAHLPRTGNKFTMPQNPQNTNNTSS